MPRHGESQKNALMIQTFKESMSQELGLFGITALLGIGAAVFPISRMLLDGIRIWIHEIGHATAAWIFSRQASPLPLGWTNIEPDKNYIVYFGLSLLLGYWIYYLLAKEAFAKIVIPLVIWILCTWGAWFASDIQFEYWVTISGVRAEFLLSTLMIVLYFVQFPQYFKWPALRVLVAFAGFFCLCSSTIQWFGIHSGSESIPFGTLLGGADDSGGDLNQLVDAFHWSEGQIISHFYALGWIGWSIVLGVLGLQILRWRMK